LRADSRTSRQAISRASWREAGCEDAAKLPAAITISAREGYRYKPVFALTLGKPGFVGFPARFKAGMVKYPGEY
jgi:hypothetical protein